MEQLHNVGFHDIQCRHYIVANKNQKVIILYLCNF
uniref:Uncharacterized protein n=1 Tax=Siphoviridae sp. ctLqe90 TaxID=2825456 RepID=A0A8S5Q220_9CAUD|nr:MAG TPA: hypothetical protein [Siphoviridae sp. ctLqe90]